MRAVICRQYGSPETLVVEDVPSPEPGPGQVAIDVHACGVQFADSLFIQGKYQVKVPPPFSPGSEVAGVVKQLGAGVTSCTLGDRVLAFTYWGGFAERVVVDASRVMVIPEGIDDVSAAAMLVSHSTTLHALRDRGALAAGETLLVLGAAGGTGLAAIQIGKIMGARVIAAASSEEKLAICRTHGADAQINYSRDDLREQIKSLTNGRGVNVVYDAVGGDLTEPAMRGMAQFGRYLVIGFAAGSIPTIPINLPLLKIFSIVGVFWGAFADMYPERQRAIVAQLFDWFLRDGLRPHVSAVFPLDRAADAILEVAQRRSTGKVVVLTAMSGASNQFQGS